MGARASKRQSQLHVEVFLESLGHLDLREHMGMKLLTWRPFMLYPHGSKTNSSMSEPCSRSAMPLLTVVRTAETKSCPL
jgi:hypothetical protein